MHIFFKRHFLFAIFLIFHGFDCRSTYGLESFGGFLFQSLAILGGAYYAKQKAPELVGQVKSDIRDIADELKAKLADSNAHAEVIQQLLLKLEKNPAFKKQVHNLGRILGESLVKGVLDGGILGLLNSPYIVDKYLAQYPLEPQTEFAKRYENFKQFSTITVDNVIEPLNQQNRFNNFVSKMKSSLTMVCDGKIDFSDGNQSPARAARRKDKTIGEIISEPSYSAKVKHELLHGKQFSIDFDAEEYIETISKIIVGYFKARLIDLTVEGSNEAIMMMIENLIEVYIWRIVLDDKKIDDLAAEILLLVKDFAYKVFIAELLTKEPQRKSQVSSFCTSLRTQEVLSGVFDGIYRSTRLPMIYGKLIPHLPQVAQDNFKKIEGNPALQLTLSAVIFLGIPYWGSRRIMAWLHSRKNKIFTPDLLLKQKGCEGRLDLDDVSGDINSLKKLILEINNKIESDKMVEPLLLQGSFNRNSLIANVIANSLDLTIYTLDLGELSEHPQKMKKVRELLDFIKDRKAILMIKGEPIANSKQLYQKIKNEMLESTTEFNGFCIFNIDNQENWDLLQTVFGARIKRVQFVQPLKKAITTDGETQTNPS